MQKYIRISDNFKKQENAKASSLVVEIMKNMQLKNMQQDIPSNTFFSTPIFIKSFFHRFCEGHFVENIRRFLIILFCFFFGFLPLSGCELLGLEDSSVKNDQVQSGNRSDRRKKEEEKEAEEEEEFTYNPIGKRDPFRSFLAFTSDNSIIDNIPRTPLQRYDIEQYTLTGIISGIDRPRALVEDPTGIGHVMELGDYIGTNWGKVTSIEDSMVIITEEYKTIEDELVTRPIKLTLNTSNNSGL